MGVTFQQSHIGCVENIPVTFQMRSEVAYSRRHKKTDLKVEKSVRFVLLREHTLHIDKPDFHGLPEEFCSDLSQKNEFISDVPTIF